MLKIGYKKEVIELLKARAKGLEWQLTKAFERETELKKEIKMLRAEISYLNYRLNKEGK